MLIAEDDPHDIFLIKRALDKSGLPIKPRFFNDGEEALDYLLGRGPFENRKTYPLPHLLLLDVKMPGKTGFDVLHDVRATPALKRLVTVMFSSSSEQRDVDRAYDLGANAYVVKPTDSGELPTLLRRIHEFWFLANLGPSGTDKSSAEFD
jgi:CheY-like chemotaxis protein